MAAYTKEGVRVGQEHRGYTFHDMRAKSLSDAGSLEEARIRANHSDSCITQAVDRRLPEMATVMSVPHIKSKNKC